MSDVKRYHVKGAWIDEPFYDMSGAEMVLASDYAALEAKLAAVTAERDALLCELERHASIEEKAHLQTIDERDRAEEALSQAYYLVVGHSPEWSNLFGHQDALEEIDDAQRCFRSEIKALRAALNPAQPTP
jgi:hypothetical protein